MNGFFKGIRGLLLYLLGTILTTMGAAGLNHPQGPTDIGLGIVFSIAGIWLTCWVLWLGLCYVFRPLVRLIRGTPRS